MFVFDGSLITFFGNDGKVDDSELKYDVEVSTLKGYDHKEYIGIDPIYDGTPYFQTGETRNHGPKKSTKIKRKKAKLL